MKYAEAKSALLKSAREAQAQLVRELAEIDAVVKALEGSKPPTFRKKQGRGGPRTTRKKVSGKNGETVLLVRGGKKTLVGHILRVLKKHGPMTTPGIYGRLQRDGIKCTPGSVGQAASGAKMKGIISHVPQSRLWALAKKA